MLDTFKTAKRRSTCGDIKLIKLVDNSNMLTTVNSSCYSDNHLVDFINRIPKSTAYIISLHVASPISLIAYEGLTNLAKTCKYIKKADRLLISKILLNENIINVPEHIHKSLYKVVASYIEDTVNSFSQ